MEAWVSGLALWGPGLESFDRFGEMVRAGKPYAGGALPPVDPGVLSARERRRASGNVRLALSVATDAVERAGADPSSLPAVFGTSQGEGETTHTLLESVTADTPFISPTLFHNSVHNTPAGFWSIAAGGTVPCDSVAAGDHTFGAALLAAFTFAAVERRAVLLVVFDSPMPKPLGDQRPIADPFATAFVFEHGQAERSIARLRVTMADRDKQRAESLPRLSGLEALSAANPAARSLPLLEALAHGEASTITVAHAVGALLDVQVDPC